MKLRIAGIFSLLVGMTFLIIGCPAKTNSPSSPAGPANTPTVTDSPTITLSPTQTGTPTNSFTPTATRTPTNTATVTDTPTVTNSATNSATPTYTGTPTNSATTTETDTITNTATVTDTASLTLTPTETLTTTQTGTPTNTTQFTSTATVTQTPTTTATLIFTSSPTHTGTPTITPTSTGYSISGTVDYNGTLTTVTAGHPIVILCSTTSAFTTYFRAAEISTNNSSFSFSVPSAGTYYMIASVGTVNIPPCQGNQITQGAVLGVYGSCTTGLTATVVTGNTTGVNFTFGDTCGQYTGESGGVTYTGSLGTISSTLPIVLEAYSDASYTSSLGEDKITCNNTTFSEPTTEGSPARYCQAFVDLNNDGTLDVGDPYINLGLFTPSTTLTIPISFGDNSLYTTAFTISGTVTYQGAGSNKLFLVLQSGGNPVSVLGPVNNGGSYSFAGITTQASEIYAGYDATGNGIEIVGTNVLQGNGSSLTGSNDVVCLVGYTGSCPNTNGQHGTSYSTTTTLNIVFGGSTGQSGTSCTQ